MKAYVSVDHISRKKLSKEIIALGMALSSASVEQFIFVDKFTFEEGQEVELMQKALKEIDNSNFVIVETTYETVATSVEVGYAKARRKPIVYLQHENVAISPVLYGLSNFHIKYSSPKDLFDQMADFLKNILPQE